MNMRTVLLLSFICLLSCGCGSQGPQTQHVEGVVFVDSQPIQHATVNFIPDSPGALFACSNTDASGKFILTATEGGKIGGGTTIGKYKVSLSKKTVTFKTPAVVVDKRTVIPPKGPPIFKYEIPKIFDDEKTTPISVEITKGKNNFVFNLDSKGGFDIK